MYETLTISPQVQEEHIFESEAEATYLLDVKKDFAARTAGFQTEHIVDRLDQHGLTEVLDLANDPITRDTVVARNAERLSRLREKNVQRIAEAAYRHNERKKNMAQVEYDPTESTLAQVA